MNRQKSGACFGWTFAEFRMWLSMFLILAVTMYVQRELVQWDYFRIFFFSAPAWITLIIGPCMTERRLYKLLVHGLFMFIGFWLVLHSYPAQCRHAWGTKMVSDSRYWGNETAQKDAIMKEKDNFFIMKNVGNKETHDLFVGGAVSNRSLTIAKENAGDSMTEVMNILNQETQAKASEDEKRERKWIAPLAGGGSMETLILRAYCNIHMNDKSLPHVFPFRVLGMGADSPAMPCEYWTCILTEVHPEGKQMFWIIVAGMGMVTWMHYRIDCSIINWWLGSGRSRIFWTWFWATLIPFLLVLFIKTTYDGEITSLVMVRLKQAGSNTTEWFGDDIHKIGFGVGCVVLIVVYIYWEPVRDYLGIPNHPFAQCFLNRGAAQEALEERTFQVCVWRLDMQAHHNQFDGSPGGDGASEGEAYQDRHGSRSWLFGNRPTALSVLSGGGGLSLWGRDEDQDTLRTHDGRRPTLVIKFFYGQREIQKTRVLRPTQSEWGSKSPVYVQENFRVSIAFRPGTPLRVEVQDTGAPLGTVSIGEASFDEMKLSRQFQNSRHAKAQSGQVPVHQVIKMLAVQGSGSNVNEREHQKELQDLGFAPHTLSDGGAVWLAFCETDLGNQSTEAGLGVCCGA